MYDAAAGTLQLYVNGAAATATPPSRTATWNATGKFALGRTLAGGQAAQVLHGWIDETRVYNRVLSPDEVLGLLAADGVTAGTWKLDGNANDSSSHQRHGQLSGAPEWAAGQTSSPDPDDLAVRLNGTDQYISADHVVATDVSFSVTAWARLDRVGGTATVVSQDGANRSGFSLGALPDGRWAFTAPQADLAGAELDSAVSLAAATQVGVWTHLAGVYSKDRKLLELYVNGALAGSDAHTTAPRTTGRLAIGRVKVTATQYGEYFPGAVDDVKLYSRALFASEVHTMAGRDLSLVHHWQLDENAGTTTADSVGVRGGTLARSTSGRASDAMTRGVAFTAEPIETWQGSAKPRGRHRPKVLSGALHGATFGRPLLASWLAILILTCENVI